MGTYDRRRYVDDPFPRPETSTMRDLTRRETRPTGRETRWTKTVSASEPVTYASLPLAPIDGEASFSMQQNERKGYSRVTSRRYRRERRELLVGVILTIFLTL